MSVNNDIQNLRERSEAVELALAEIEDIRRRLDAVEAWWLQQLDKADDDYRASNAEDES